MDCHQQAGQGILHWRSVGNLWMVSLDVAENPPLDKCW